MANNSTNKARGYVARIDDWEAFERLPCAVRNALNDAKFEWSAAWCYNKLRKNRMTVSEIILAIAKGDQKQIEKDRERVWGIVPEVSAEELGI